MSDTLRPGEVREVRYTYDDEGDVLHVVLATDPKSPEQTYRERRFAGIYLHRGIYSELIQRIEIRKYSEDRQSRTRDLIAYLALEMDYCEGFYNHAMRATALKQIIRDLKRMSGTVTMGAALNQVELEDE